MSVEQLSVELSQVELARQARVERLHQLQRAEIDLLGDLGQESGPSTNGAGAVHTVGCLDALWSDIASEIGVIAAHQAQIDAIRERLTGARTATKALEKLQDSELEEFARENRLREQAESSETAALQYQRAHVVRR
jgi:flagellar export protein FliJ